MSGKTERPALLDLPELAAYLGQPVNSVRRWIHRPPSGFPKPVMIGRKITYRAAEIELWALGSAAPQVLLPAVPNPSEPPKRGPGRPPKVGKETAAPGQGV